MAVASSSKMSLPPSLPRPAQVHVPPTQMPPNRNNNNNKTGEPVPSLSPATKITKNDTKVGLRKDLDIDTAFFTQAINEATPDADIANKVFAYLNNLQTFIHDCNLDFSYDKNTETFSLRDVWLHYDAIQFMVDFVVNRKLPASVRDLHKLLLCLGYEDTFPRGHLEMFFHFMYKEAEAVMTTDSPLNPAMLSSAEQQYELYAPRFSREYINHIRSSARDLVDMTITGTVTNFAQIKRLCCAIGLLMYAAHYSINYTRTPADSSSFYAKMMSLMHMGKKALPAKFVTRKAFHIVKMVDCEVGSVMDKVARMYETVAQKAYFRDDFVLVTYHQAIISKLNTGKRAKVPIGIKEITAYKIQTSMKLLKEFVASSYVSKFRTGPRYENCYHHQQQNRTKTTSSSSSTMSSWRYNTTSAVLEPADRMPSLSPTTRTPLPPPLARVSPPVSTRTSPIVVGAFTPSPQHSPSSLPALSRQASPLPSLIPPIFARSTIAKKNDTDVTPARNAPTVDEYKSLFAAWCTQNIMGISKEQGTDIGAFYLRMLFNTYLMSLKIPLVPPESPMWSHLTCTPVRYIRRSHVYRVNRSFCSLSSSSVTKIAPKRSVT